MTMENSGMPATGALSPDGIRSYGFRFHGSGGTLFGIQIVNLFLIIITLGIYYFWAKVKVRNYLWSQVEFDRDRLSYHGTPKESLIGWLKAFLVFGIPFLLFQNAPQMLGAGALLVVMGGLLSLALISIFIPIAVVGMRRYRFSRTSLRGIRFSFRGRWQAFARIFYSSMFFNLITLGLYMPYYAIRKNRFFMEHTYYGNTQFGFDGHGSDLIGKYVIALLLAFPSLFVSMIWYQCVKTRYLWDHAYLWNDKTFQGVRFRSDITFGGVFWLFLSNILILVFTLGFGAPWVKVRVLAYYLGNLSLKGQIDFDAIVQQALGETATAEEIGDFLDMDFDLG